MIFRGPLKDFVSPQTISSEMKIKLLTMRLDSISEEGKGKTKQKQKNPVGFLDSSVDKPWSW